ncbi:hypothetical protein LPJ61_003537 [Coemansia biformis]|uniref:Bromodomain associated domain-containing protein n=1 Tax=Coemansia biformis TaxID=1286918 RepID=A0A9W7YB10_9FUNG|nr:hypothetical protein LPJ61_003537 [Coemansia biformis]
MPRQPERLAARQNRGRETHASTKAHRSLVGPRLYGGIYGAVPTHSHFEKAMRGSAHRVVSATTRFDSVTAGALSLLADAARQYLMRIGDSSKARADLAGRTDPNIYDVLGAGESGPCIDLDPLRRWADGWKGEVGDIMPSAPQPAIEHAMVAHGHGFGDIAGESPVDHTMAEQNGDAVGLGGDAADEDDIDAIINGLGLSCLLLDGPGIGGEFEGPIPPHLPQMARLTDHGDGESPGTYGNGGVASPVPPSPESLVPEKASVVAAAGASSGDAGYSGEPAGLGSDNEEETAESMAAHILHLVSSSLSALNPSIAAGGALSSFFRPAAKADPTCDLDNIIPSFDIPESGFVPAPEYIQRRLAQAEKLEPGAPIFLSSSSPQRDTLGDTEEQWRQAKHRLHAGIYNVAAERAVEEMDDAPVPVRRRRVSDASEKESRPWQLAVGDKAKTAEPNDEMEVDINIDEDVMDIDLDLDIMGGPSDHRAEADDQEVHDVFARELHAAAEQCVAAAPERPAPEDVPEAALEAEPEPIVLPVSNGLRGSGKPHWSGEWFSAAMRKRLSRITAQDIVPCDSLFLSSPSASHRHVLDEVARAFVDSEGGGHLHETTPLEGFGPSANTYTVPSASGSALRWTLHHIMQTRGVKTVDSLYAGRSSLAGGVAGHGVGQYVSRMCSLVKGSAEEEADLVVSGAVRAAGDRDGDQWSNRKINPTQLDLMEQLVAGVEKRVPWAQERLDIHVLESRIVDRQPRCHR